ncbi:hypothetical protein [Parasitella parasitica]|uniref:HMG box domain-containing protein n=1 Tax=Parasitella parasitica TaxID=35722 RepID=A0A0B7N966_9FUNG|nr:hypothetical protein [Parasitella parasitica]
MNSAEDTKNNNANLFPFGPSISDNEESEYEEDRIKDELDESDEEEDKEEQEQEEQDEEEQDKEPEDEELEDEESEDEGLKDRESKHEAPENTANEPEQEKKRKRLPGIFVNFNKQVRGKLAKENKNLSQRELSKLVSNIWNSMSKRDEIQEQKNQYLKPEITESPIKPPSGNGYLLFYKEQVPIIRDRYKLKGQSLLKETSAIIGVRWKQLDKIEKQVYNEKAKKSRREWAEKHPVEFEAYLESRRDKLRKHNK